jgi:hypothetical protein
VLAGVQQFVGHCTRSAGGSGPSIADVIGAVDDGSKIAGAMELTVARDRQVVALASLMRTSKLSASRLWLLPVFAGCLVSVGPARLQKGESEMRTDDGADTSARSLG